MITFVLREPLRIQAVLPEPDFPARILIGEEPFVAHQSVPCVKLPFWTAFFRGVLCNVLVCMAVWMSFAGRSVTDKFFAIVLPISAFVAAGFEHSIANMYFFPMAFLLQWTGTPLPAGTLPVGVGDMLGNLFPVILGNIAGGSVLVALVYWQVYLRPARKGGD